ncbi:hypothetical protein TNCT_401161 [Trichonephila clavata]|uniref:Uncharacterized protein n=1 Tax=Trichonephila clavata TaxID=2740835 RepID=A0A8X6LF83_TRICU|nr:hypothetical protein TNCT_401161 [Trichonephila clavata]
MSTIKPDNSSLGHRNCPHYRIKHLPPKDTLFPVVKPEKSKKNAQKITGRAGQQFSCRILPNRESDILHHCWGYLRGWQKTPTPHPFGEREKCYFR